MSTSTSHLSPSHVLLSTFLDLDAEDLIQHEGFLQNIMNALSVFSLNQQISVAALNTSSNPKAALASGNALLAKWLTKVMSMIQKDDPAIRLAGLRFLSQIIQSADHTMVQTQHEVWTRVLLQLGKDEVNNLPTKVAISSLSALLILFNRALVWPDTWREVSAACPKFMTLIVNQLMFSLSSHLIPIDAKKTYSLPETDAMVDDETAAAPAKFSSQCIVLSDLPAITRLSYDEECAITDLLRLIHDSLIRSQLNSTFRAHVATLEAICIRVIDITPSSKTSEKGTIREFSSRILALLSHVIPFKAYQQSLQSQQAEKNKQGPSTITLVTVDHKTTISTEIKNKAPTAFDNDDVGSITTSATSTVVSAASSTASFWSIIIRRLISSIAFELDGSLPKAALQEALFSQALDAQRQPHSPEPYILPRKPSSGHTLATAEVISSRVTNMFQAITNFLTVFPVEQSISFGLNATAASQSSKSRSSNNSSISIHNEVVTLPCEDYIGAIPLYEILITLRCIFALEPQPFQSTGIVTSGDDRRLSAVSYFTILPLLQISAMKLLKTIIKSSRKSILPHARQISSWILSILTRTSPTVADAGIGSSSGVSFLSLGSASGQAYRSELRALSYETATLLLQNTSLPMLYKTFVEPASAQALADVAAHISRSLLLIREGCRTLNKASASMTGSDQNPLSVMANDDILGLDDSSSRLREKRRAKKQKKENLISSLPGATYGVASTDAANDDDDDDEEEVKATEEVVDTSANPQFGTTNPAPFGAPIRRKRPAASSGKTDLSSAFSSLYKSLAALATPKNASPMPFLLPETASRLVQQASLAAVNFLCNLLAMPSLPAVMSNDLRAAIDRTLMTTLFALVADGGSRLIKVSAPIVQGLYEMLYRSLRLPSNEQNCISALVPYAARFFRFAAASSDPSLVLIAQKGLSLGRILISPAAPPPSLSASTVSLLNSIHNRADNSIGAPSAAPRAGAFSSAGFGASNTNNAGFGFTQMSSGGDSGSSADSSFPLHLFHYQQLFSYSDADEQAIEAAARPSPLIVLPSQASLMSSVSHAVAASAPQVVASQSVAEQKSIAAVEDVSETQAHKTLEVPISTPAPTSMVDTTQVDLPSTTNAALPIKQNTTEAIPESVQVGLSELQVMEMAGSAFETVSLNSPDKEEVKQVMDLHALNGSDDDIGDDLDQDTIKNSVDITLDDAVDDEDGDVGLWNL